MHAINIGLGAGNTNLAETDTEAMGHPINSRNQEGIEASTRRQGAGTGPSDDFDRASGLPQINERGQRSTA